MKLKDYRYTGKRPYRYDEVSTGAGDARDAKDEWIERTEENIERIAELQEMLYADGREGLIVVLQAMDAAGKDSTIKHVMRSLNPQGVDVYSFKAPTPDELAHDFLWRIEKRTPARGKIAIFNRSHYEDAVAVGVRDLYPNFRLPERCLKEDFIKRRLKMIREYEEYLYDNGVRTLKIFLNVSLDEQKKRFLERIDKPEKNWKFSKSDLDDRALWTEYQESYQRAINATATRHCPWYVLPADDKWFTRYLVSEALTHVLEKIDPKYPEPAPELIDELPKIREKLMAEE